MTEIAKEIRDQLLETALNLLPIYGLSDELLEKAEEQIYGERGRTIFVNLADFVDYLLLDIDTKMLASLEQQDTQNLKIREKIKLALLTRFTIQDHALVKQLASFFLKPQYAPLAFKSLSRTCDKIWYFAGDQSTDFNYYSKRMILAAIYSATIAYYLKTEATEKQLAEFIEQRIQDSFKLAELKNKITEIF